MLDPDVGVRIVGAYATDWSGHAVGGGGDINADGFDDVLIGARAADPGSRANAGTTYVVFGFAPTAERHARVGTAIGNAIHGGAFDDSLLGLAGDDSLFGGAGADELFGSGGSDWLDGGADADLMARRRAGNDIVRRRQPAIDLIAEQAGQGTDTRAHRARRATALGDNLENLTGTAATRAGAVRQRRRQPARRRRRQRHAQRPRGADDRARRARQRRLRGRHRRGRWTRWSSSLAKAPTWSNPRST